MPGSIVVSLIFLVIPLTLLQRCGAADSNTTYEFLHKDCSGSGNFSSDGGIVFEMNLRKFLATLPSKVISNGGFFNDSVGSTNAVFGMAMCQADLPWPDHCESCLQEATAAAPKACPSSFNTSIAYRGCVLRYWDAPVHADFADTVFYYTALYTPEHAIQVRDAPALAQVRQDLFLNLSKEIVTSPFRIATGNRTFNSTHNLYGLAQCYRDWPTGLCARYVWVPGGYWNYENQTWEGQSILSYAYYVRYSLTPFQVYVPNNSSGSAETPKDVVQYKDCSSSGNISTSNDDPYQLNLRQFLDALPSNAIQNSGFFNGTTGSDNKVFGTAMCQADIPWPNQCKNCLQAASAGAPQACPASYSASVAYQGCMLRYSDVPILAVGADEASNGIAFYTQNHPASVPDTTAFQQTRQYLLTDLAAAAVLSPTRIGSGNREFNSTHKLYGLAQCNRDLPMELCSAYIKSVTPKIATDVQWSEGVSIIGFSYYIRYDLTPFAIYVPTPIGAGGPSQSETRKGGLIQKVTIPISITIIILLLAVIVTKHFQKKRKIDYIFKVTGLKEFSYNTIKYATENFGTEQELGRGAFGKVYKGNFKIDGKNMELAVKCVIDPTKGKSLLDELVMLAKLNHTNVVQLVGFCSNNGWFLRAKGLYICTEFFSKGSLEKRISALTDHPLGPLSWPDRFKIICGICDGLKYLHENSNTMIAHMDLKPSNVLLDNKTVPKIADFGISKALAKANKTYKLYTENTVGTRGYMAPEYVRRGRFGRKCDIYSLGVLILVIVMGKEPDAYDDPSAKLFLDDMKSKFTPIDRDKLKKEAPWLEPLDNNCLEDAERCIRVAFECVDTDRDRRPKAPEILSRLLTRAAGTQTQNVVAQEVEQIPL